MQKGALEPDGRTLLRELSRNKWPDLAGEILAVQRCQAVAWTTGREVHAVVVGTVGLALDLASFAALSAQRYGRCWYSIEGLCPALIICRARVIHLNQLGKPMIKGWHLREDGNRMYM
jgi:hypothetical protein